MPWITLGGDGILVCIAVLLLCVLHRRFGLFTGISCLLASGITQLLKHTIYFEEVRPKLFFSLLPAPICTWRRKLFIQYFPFWSRNSCIRIFLA